jgi:hypothetical protein
MNSESFYCQSTNLRKATSPLHSWNIRRYIWNISSGDFGLIEQLHVLLAFINSTACEVLGKQRHFSVQGVLRRTPILTLNLQPGEFVRVRTKEEILATLDRSGRNRGLVFNVEMLEYCGKTLRVLKRVEKMINEKTNKMRQLSNTVILEGSLCDGKEHGGCQRNCYNLWREIWLEKVSD